jgi:hypothetical protein
VQQEHQRKARLRASGKRGDGQQRRQPSSDSAQPGSPVDRITMLLPGGTAPPEKQRHRDQAGGRANKKQRPVADRPEQ